MRERGVRNASGDADAMDVEEEQQEAKNFDLVSLFGREAS